MPRAAAGTLLHAATLLAELGKVLMDSSELASTTALDFTNDKELLGIATVLLEAARLAALPH